MNRSMRRGEKSSTKAKIRHQIKVDESEERRGGPFGEEMRGRGGLLPKSHAPHDHTVKQQRADSAPFLC